MWEKQFIAAIKFEVTWADNINKFKITFDKCLKKVDELSSEIKKSFVKVSTELGDGM